MPRWIARGTSGRHRTNSSCRAGQAVTLKLRGLSRVIDVRRVRGRAVRKYQFSRMPLPFRRVRSLGSGNLGRKKRSAMAKFAAEKCSPNG